MPFRFLLLPIEKIGNARGPRFFRWRYNDQGLNGRWSLKDFGHTSKIALIGTDSPIQRADVMPMPVTWSQKDRDRVGGYLRGSGIESKWVEQAGDWREALQRLAGLTQVYQSAIDDPVSTALMQDPSMWMGRKIHFGIGTLRPLDWQMYAREQDVLRQRIVEPLRVIWERERPRFDWRAMLRQMALMPLSVLMGALPATDTFTVAVDTNFSSYANWTVNSGSLQVLQATDDVRPNSNNEDAAHWNADAFGADQYSLGTITAAANNIYIGVAVRAAASGATYYGWYGEGVGVNYLHKNVSGTYTDIASEGTSWAVNDLLKLVVSGTTLTPTKNGGSTGTPGVQTDSSISSGYAGLVGYGTGATRIDDWEGGNVGGGAQTVTVNQVTETDTPQAINRQKIKALGQIIETDTSQAISAGRKYITGQTLETDLAQAIAKTKIHAVGQVTETDLAQPITPAGTSHILPVAQVTEIDLSQAISKGKIIAVAQVTETDLAQPVTRVRSTGALFPTSAANVVSAPHSAENWVNPSNIGADDATNASITAATFDSPDQSSLLIAHFNLAALPSGAAIRGVRVIVNCYYANGTVSMDLLQLLDVSGNPVGTNQCATPVALGTATSGLVTKGGNADQWGNALTDTWVKDADFGVAIGMAATGANADVFVDYVTLEVFYTGGSITGTVNQVTETDIAQAISRIKIKAIGQNAETDASQAISAARQYAVGQTLETDLAQAIAKTKIHAIAQVTETDAAQTIAPARTIAVAQIAETDSAQSISVRKDVLIGQANETDLAQAIAKTKIHAIAQVTEADAAQAITPVTSHVIPVNQVTESDLAQSIVHHKIKSVSQVTETDEAQPVTFSGTKIIAVSQVIETDTSQEITHIKIQVIAQIAETDLAQAVTHAKAGNISQVSETDLAQAIGRIKQHSVLQADEIDSAQSITRVAGILIQQVEETDLAQSLFPLKRVSVVQVVEIDISQAFEISKIKTIGQVIETDLSQQIVRGGTVIVVLGQVVETDMALSISRFIMRLYISLSDSRQNSVGLSDTRKNSSTPSDTAKNQITISDEA